MRIRVLLFGPQAALAGREAIELTIDDQTTCAQLRDRVARAEPALQPSLPASRFAINHAFASDQAVIQPDDEVALIGMVAGG